jgi:hypothetical protein
MKIIQTFWSGNNPSFLNKSFGWYNPLYHIQSWVLSCQLLKRLYKDVELYTDQAGYDLLINQLQLPYSKVHVVLDELNHYPESVWALSKIHTYSLQKEPFIHIDGDVFIWKPFDKHFTDSELLVQNQEEANHYYESMWQYLQKNLTFIPTEITKYREKSKNLDMYNFGVFGGQNLEFIQHYAKQAFKFVNRNQHILEDLNSVNFNIFFEQYLFYCLVADKKVTRYFDTVYKAEKYRDLASFEKVPHEKTFLHLLGNYKINLEVCRKMSRQLSINFPNAYEKTLDVFKRKERHLFTSIQSSKDVSNNFSLNQSFQDYYNSFSNDEKFCKTQQTLIKHFSFSKEETSDILRSPSRIHEEVKRLNDPALKLIFNYEFKVMQCLSSLKNLDMISYAKFEYDQSKQYSIFAETPDDFLIEKSMYVFEIYYNKHPHPQKNPNTEESILKIVTPAAHAPFYNEMIADELEIILLKECENLTSIRELLTTMESYFDKKELNVNYEAFSNLIIETVKQLVFKNFLTINIINNHHNTISQRIDTNPECL